MKLILTLESGAEHGRLLLLRIGQSLTIGRSEMADVPIPTDDQLSRIHFSVACANDGCHLRDLESRNGTLVNGRPVVAQLLRDGDRVVAGQTKFAVTIEGRSAPPPKADAVAPSGRTDGTNALSTDENAADSDRSVSDPLASHALPTGRISPSGPRGASAAGGTAASDTAYPFREGLADEDPSVRREALFAAVWTGQPWCLEHCREAARRPTPDNWESIQMFGILAPPGDLDTILSLGRDPNLGGRRFEILASFGHPAIVPFLLSEMDSENPAAAIAAGRAFSVILGADIDSDRRATLPPEDGSTPDAFEEAFLEEGVLPSPEAARKHWGEIRDRSAEWTRIRQGIDVGGTVSPLALAGLDMRGRWEHHLRERHFGRSLTPLSEVLAFRPA